MNLFKNFFLLLRKNAMVIIIYTTIFLVLILGMSSVYGGDTDYMFEQENYDICYIDNDNSELTRGLISYLGSNHNLTDVKDNDPASVQDLLFFRIYMHEITFDEGMEKRVLNGEDTSVNYISGLPSGAQGYVLSEQVNDYISTYKTYIEMGYDKSEAASKTTEVLNDHANVTVIHDTSEENLNENVTIFVASQYYWYALFSSICFSAGVVIISGMEDSLASRIEASPVSRTKRNFINGICICLSGLVVYGLFVILMLAVGRDSSNWKEFGWVYLINGLLATLTCCSITGFLTSFKVKEKSLNIITNIIGMSFAFLGGEFVPQSILGDNVIAVAKFLPTYWFIRANNMTHSKGGLDYSQPEMLKCFAIQILFILVFFVGSMAVGKVRTSARK